MYFSGVIIHHLLPILIDSCFFNFFACLHIKHNYHRVKGRNALFIFMHNQNIRQNGRHGKLLMFFDMTHNFFSQKNSQLQDFIRVDTYSFNSMKCD